MRITRLSIQDFVIIEQLDLDLGHGLNVLSGGSGEGKTLVVRALDFLLGGQPSGRARAAHLVRQGASEACVEATVLGRSHALDDALRAAGVASAGDASLVISRTLDRAGRGRCTIRCGESEPVAVPVAALRPIGAALVEVFAQGEATALVEEERQRTLLDLAAGAARDARAYAEARGRALELAREHDVIAAEEARLRDDHARAAEERDALADLDPRPGEYEASVEELERLEGRDAELQQLAAVVALVDGDDTETGPACERLRHALARLDRLECVAEPQLAAARDALEGALAQAADAVERLRRVHDGFDLDPERVEALRERVSAFRTLGRRLRTVPEALALRWHELGPASDPAQLAERRERLAASLREVRPELDRRRDDLSRARGEAAGRLSRAVVALLPELGLDGGRFEVLVSTQEASPTAAAQPVSPTIDEAQAALLRDHPAPHGRDRVAFLFAAGPAQPLGPLGRASGGELARLFLALALETAAAGSDVPLLVFDEVDQNVGARLGGAVGRCLAGIGRGRQVLAITHLATVAARADHHVRILKEAGRTRAERLEGDARVEELALMIKGPPLTAAALAQARELLAEATPGTGPRSRRPKPAKPAAPRRRRDPARRRRKAGRNKGAAHA